MKKIPIHLVVVLLINNGLLAQADTAAGTARPAYAMRGTIEFPAEAAGLGLTAYNFSRISDKSSTDAAVVKGLGKKDVNWFDRWGVRKYNENIDNASYVPFYVCIPVPLVLFSIDKKMRKDFFKLSFMYAEALTATGILYSAAAGYVNRYRPLVYSNETPLEKRTASDSKKSFLQDTWRSLQHQLFLRRASWLITIRIQNLNGVTIPLPLP